ncbi:MAG: hypothetical protein WC956_04815 [bacterium]
MNLILRTALLSLCFIVLTAFSATLCFAQDEDAGAASSSSSSSSASQHETTPFILIILGTRNSGDVDVIRKNVSRLPYVKKFVPLFESQKHIEFLGGLSGSTDTLVADVRSLAADRYEMESRDDKRRGLVITLRKIQQ